MQVMTQEATPDVSESPRRRQPSAETLAARQAARFVRDLNRQLGTWQATSVKLHTMAARLKATGRTDSSVAEEASEMLRVVRSEAQRFEAKLPDYPAEVARHSRIEDTRRSFEMIADRLRNTLGLLGAEPPSRGNEDRVLTK